MPFIMYSKLLLFLLKTAKAINPNKRLATTAAIMKAKKSTNPYSMLQCNMCADSNCHAMEETANYQKTQC